MEECRSCSNVETFTRNDVDPSDVLQPNVSITLHCHVPTSRRCLGLFASPTHFWQSGGDFFGVYKK